MTAMAILSTYVTFVLTYQMIIAYTDYLATGDMTSAEEVEQIAINMGLEVLATVFMQLVCKALLKSGSGKGNAGASEGGIKAIDNAIPNVENATINPKKLTEYALNPNHPVGGNKAKVFESALGYNQSNADDLMRQIYEKLPNSEAVLGQLDEYGQRYTVDIPITGPNGNTVNVRTGWIIKTGSDIPELTTLFVKD
ncbi:MAG: hypothetical protein IJ429_04945, partial [Lachnospiraceae bacterium]|nr:hypothetical protein [Lachnospiraceae bacterium]